MIRFPNHLIYCSSAKIRHASDFVAWHSVVSVEPSSLSHDLISLVAINMAEWIRKRSGFA